MRAGGITVQQTLTTEAASVLKHSLSLARRRGHAQVTPLHVAATLLSSRTSLLRRACLKSQSPLGGPTNSSHPLHSRALELCFNVALNRLPTTPGPLLHGQPSLSNALIAALKRAQAHQRRGCIEQQQQHNQHQQPLLAIKVELEQLILSILDDPSVSRVMREAGFSSTLVKNNLEDSASVSPVFQYCYNGSNSGGGGVYSSPCSPNSVNDVINPPLNLWHSHFLSYSSDQNPLLFSPYNKKVTTDSSECLLNKKDDIKLVFEVLMRKKRRNTVIVGDSVGMTEALVSDIMGKIERGRVDDDDDVPEDLKSAHFIRFQFSSVPLRFMRRDEVEMNLSDLKRKVDSIVCGGGGVVIFTGDLKWTVDDHVYGEEMRESKYSAVDHLVAELGRLISEYSSSNMKVWLMGTANYQTYMKCQMKQPSLEIQWALQAVSVPSGGLGLSLNAASVHDTRMAFCQSPSQVIERKPLTNKEEHDVFTCCAECTSNYEKEAALFKSGQQNKPFWLQSQGSESLQRENLVELRRKWSRLCYSLHQRRLQNQMDSSLFNSQHLIGKSYSYTSTYPYWPNQNSISPDNNSISFADSVLKHNRVTASTVPRFRRQQSCHIEFNYTDRDNKHQGNEPNLNSLKSGEGKEVKITLALGNSVSSDSGKGELDGDMCKLLQENVPWHSEQIPSIVQVLVEHSKSIKKESSWFLIHGDDHIAKKRLALAIAESVFGSGDFLLCMNMRQKEHKLNLKSEILEKALRNHGKLVVLVEDVEFADPQFIKFLSDGFKTGKFGDSSGSETIFILTKGTPRNCINDGKKITSPVIQMKLQLNETSPRSDQKRKAECDILSRSKSARFSEKEIECLIITENGNNKKGLSRQSSSNSLDLNMVADDDETEKFKSEFSPIETVNGLENPLGFLESIKNQFVFDQDRKTTKAGMFLSKMKRSFKEVFGSENNVLFYVEEAVLEELVYGCGLFLDSLFDKWLKDILQTSLNTVKSGAKETVSIRLCLDGEKEGGIEENGYMGSNLPNKVHST